MKNIKFKARMYGLLLSFLFLLLYSIDSVAQNFRQLTVADGLASSVVTCIHQTEDGMLWFGTLNGMNAYYGDEIFRLDMDSIGSLEGVFVDNIVESGNQKLWIQASRNLFQFNPKENKTVSFLHFMGNFLTRSVSHDKIMTLNDNNQLFLYKTDSNSYYKVDYVPKQNVLDLGGTEGFCWFAVNNGIYRYELLQTEDGKVVLDKEVCLLDLSLKYCQVSDDPGFVYVIDDENRLFKLDILQGTQKFVLDLKNELDIRGIPVSVVENKGIWYVAFKTAGVLRCEYDISKKKWTYTDLGIQAGVFAMKKDRNQDLIWIATDGQGVYAYWEDVYSVRSYLYNEVNPRLSKPLRTLFVDDHDILWIGTKGDGLLSIDRNDHQLKLYDCPQKLYTSSNSSLLDNSVYALSASAHGGFWIGTEQGLNFYHYKSQSLVHVPGSEAVEYVHAIKEIGDSVLWIATVGKGVFKASVKSSGTSVYLDHLQHFELDDGKMSSNYFYNMYEAEKGLLLGNRGQGLFKATTHGLEPFVWTTDAQLSNSYKWIYDLYEHEDILWIVTGAGLIGLNKEGKIIHAPKNDFQSGRIHSLMGDSRGELWTVWDNGLSRYTSDLSEVHNYGSKYGLGVSEFSDGAVYSSGENLYFGGVNGWIEINVTARRKQMPKHNVPLYVFNLKSNHKNFLLRQSNVGQNGKVNIQLERDDNVFTVYCQAMDYLNMDDYSYYYKISKDGKSNWIENGSTGKVSLAQLQPGNYTFQVKYRNISTGYESEPVSLNIYVKPDWWLSPWMKAFYWILLILSVVCLSLRQHGRNKRRQSYMIQKMEQAHKEELYEEKLRFFTNITHEFCTPLTLIYGPCERILNYEGTDEFIRKYASVIQKQAKSLYQLIQEIIDYRRIETKHQTLALENYNISEYIHDVCEPFIEIADNNKVSFTKEIEEGIFWNMDRRILPKIVVNLLSNAMKYTPVGGQVKVGLSRLSDSVLQLKIYNTGKGIKEEDRVRIFNRYSILEGEEGNAYTTKSRNGLGMAVCYSSVKLLEGDITINSVVGSYAEFVVTLPLLPLPEGGAKSTVNDVVTLDMQHLEIAEQADIDTSNEQVSSNSLSIYQKIEKPVVLVVDDNQDILFLLREMMSDTYEVKTAHNAEEAWAFLKNALPHLIIADVMMPGTDGLSLVQQIRQNKYTMHLPVVILSARSTDEAKVEGLKAGADIYIGKPFNVQYLLSAVKRLLDNRGMLKEYYNSSASSQVYLNRQLVKREDREFVEALNNVMEESLSDCDLTMEKIAAAMNLSIRSLYRRLAEMNLPSPKEYIKEQRMNQAAKLLKTTAKSIQEIIFECGFRNRTHFYNDFSKRFGMTPKEFRNHSSDTLDEK